MQVLVNDLQTKFKIGKRLIKRVIERALKDLTGDVIYPLEVSIALVNDEFIQSLNKRYRGVNEATDVLAFPQDQAASQIVYSPQSIVHGLQSIVHSPQSIVHSQKSENRSQEGSRNLQVASSSQAKACGYPPILLGDIVVSLDMAECQAKEYHLPLEEEVINLTLHGLLHLLGYKDSTPKQRKVMENKQREILRGKNEREASLE